MTLSVIWMMEIAAAVTILMKTKKCARILNATRRSGFSVRTNAAYHSGRLATASMNVAMGLTKTTTHFVANGPCPVCRTSSSAPMTTALKCPKSATLVTPVGICQMSEDATKDTATLKPRAVANTTALSSAKALISAFVQGDSLVFLEFAQLTVYLFQRIHGG